MTIDTKSPKNDYQVTLLGLRFNDHVVTEPLRRSPPAGETWR